MTSLKFQKNNAKLDNTHTFSLPAGWSCPFASDCLSKVVVNDGKRSIVDGKDCKFRCFAASQEALYTNTYKARKHNFDLLRKLKTVDAMADLIDASLPKPKSKRGKALDCVRIHVSGDFFNQRYFDAWCEVARRNPDVAFYAYTKSLRYWVARLDSIPANLALTASEGGTQDELITEYNLKYAKVVFSEQEAAELGLPIDHDDSHAKYGEASFALLIHGTQPKGSEAAKAKAALKGKGSYPTRK